MNKYLVVTGANGFMGSYLADSLIKKKYKVIKVDKKISGENNNILKIDLLSDKEIFQKLNMYNIDRVIHFAAISDIDYSAKYPKKTLNNNYLSTLNLLNFCRLKKIKFFDFASSIYTYSAQGSFYRISKLLCEEIIEEYSRLYQIRYNIFRYGSLIGLKINDQNPIIKMIEDAKNKKEIYRSGYGKEIRSYIFIDDAIDLTIKCIFKNKKNNIYDITGKKNIKVINILDFISTYFEKKTKKKIKILLSKKSNPHHYIKTPLNKKVITIKTFTPKAENLKKKLGFLIDRILN